MPPIYRSLDEKKDLEAKNGALQFLQVVSEIEDWKSGTSQISPKLLLSLQHRAIVNIYSCAGNFRTGPVYIKDGDLIVHEPPPWQEVQGLVDEMCKYVNDGWDYLSAVHIAAYLLWRLNWIHPFFGGNGRTARSISYLALCAKLGFRMPGKVTIPDHIVKRRNEYIGALRIADKAWESRKIDVLPMEQLMESVMAAQMIEVIQQATGRPVIPET